MAEHQVIVGNIGCVYNGPHDFVARLKHKIYVGESKKGHGRAAGESVTWLKDGEIFKEYIGTVDRNKYQV